MCIDILHTKRGGIGHPTAQAAGTKAMALAGKGHNPAMPTDIAPDAKKPSAQNPVVHEAV